MANDLMQIGEVAERTGLSLRTIRHYEDVGILSPPARSQGGFRLYSDQDVARLMVIRRMKPLDFTLDQMRDLLDIIDRLSGQSGKTRSKEAGGLTARLREYQDAAEVRCQELRAQLAIAEEFAATLAEHGHQAGS